MSARRSTGPRVSAGTGPRLSTAQPPAPTVVYEGGDRTLVGAREVDIAQLSPDPTQPRKSRDPERLEELAASIAAHGVLQPLLVRQDGMGPDGDMRYTIIAGERRYAAIRLAIKRATSEDTRRDLCRVPVVIRDSAEAERRVLQLIENLQREDLPPLDEARAYQELIEYNGLSPQGLADLLHISGQHIRERLRLLADQVLADAVARRQISATAARDILRLPDAEVMAFKDRVVAGETLQSNDVAAARARLAAAGAPHPRRKGGGRPAREPSPTLSAGPGLAPSAAERRPEADAPPSTVAPGSADRAGTDVQRVAGSDQATLDRAMAPQNQTTLDLPREQAPLDADALEAAEVVVAAIAQALRGRHRADVAAALGRLDGHEQWAIRVVQMLRERLGTEPAEHRARAGASS